MRNSWGPSWGEKGYLRMQIADGVGTCGIQIRPAWPETRSATTSTIHS